MRLGAFNKFASIRGSPGTPRVRLLAVGVAVYRGPLPVLPTVRDTTASPCADARRSYCGISR